MTEDKVCDSCKRYVGQRIGHYKGWMFNLAAYGCDKRNATGVPCERNDVIQYLFEQLAEVNKREDSPEEKNKSDTA